MDATGVLDAWMNRHGSLDKQLQARFLARPELTILCDLPGSAVLQAITHHRQLDKIVNSAAAFTTLDDVLEEDSTARAERRAANAAARRAARTQMRTEQGQPSSETPNRSSGRREWRQFNHFRYGTPKLRRASTSSAANTTERSRSA